MDEERRQNWTCGAHHELVESLRDINGKLDGMIVRQIEYAETSARIEERQENIERIVTNGLSHNVADIAKRLDIFCDEVKNDLMNWKSSSGSGNQSQPFGMASLSRFLK